MVFLSNEFSEFPDPRLYHPAGGLMAYGGDLSPERIWNAYKNGIFPWFNPDEEILWWSPDPRFVLFPEEVKVSKSMKKILNRGVFTFTENVCFEEVIHHCQNIERADQDGTWITEDIINGFLELNELGKAKSIEVWYDEELVGGFYGLEVNGIFCGESMFSLMSNASKAGFLHFVLTQGHRYSLIDCQVHSDHLESLGARMISKELFYHYLDA